jgi:ribosomal protein S18 acetylase RimI-like enzyme
MTIRRATYEEAKSIKAWDVFIGDRRIDNDKGELFVALENDEIQGYITYSSNRFYNKPFISLLCIKEAAQRKGMASALMKTVLANYVGLAVWTSTEEWNEPAIKLFEKLGFVKKGAIAGLNKDDSSEMFFVLPASAITR